MFDAGVESFRVFAHDDQIDARIARRNMRQVANGPEVREKLEALAQLDIDAREAAAMGVVTGPFSPTRVRSIDSESSLGMYSWYFSKASAPAAKLSHSNLTPVASSMRTVASMTSGPMPSPGDESYFMSSHWIRRQLSH